MPDDLSSSAPAMALPLAALAAFMPMHLALDRSGGIVGSGPTIRRIAGLADSGGEDFFTMFEVRRPSGIVSMAQLLPHVGMRMFLKARGRKGPGFRGVAMPGGAAGGAIINLTFGAGIIEAVGEFRLTEADFAITDLAIELLYVVEAKSAIMEELRALNLRLQGAKSAAEEQAQTDVLTGLRNRRAFDRGLQLALAEAGRRPFALMHLDLDFFKQVNDSLGHAAGDEVLRRVAAILTQETRSSDIVARVGGDEFMILLPRITDRAGLSAIAQRIIDRLQQPILHEGRLCRIAASVGLWSSVGSPFTATAEILAGLDGALYAAKRQGRGRACFAGTDADAMPADGRHLPEAPGRSSAALSRM